LPGWVSTFLNHLQNRVTDGGEFSGMQLSGLSCNKAGVGGKKLARTSIAA